MAVRGQAQTEHPAGRSLRVAALDDCPALLGGHCPDPGEQDLAGTGESVPRIVGVALDLLDRGVQALDGPDDRIEIGALGARNMREDLRRRPALALRAGSQSAALRPRHLDQLLA